VTEVRRDLRSAGKPLDSDAWRRAIEDQQVNEAIASGDREGARRRILKSLMPGQ
jgi:hypothetical protein